MAARASTSTRTARGSRLRLALAGLALGSVILFGVLPAGATPSTRAQEEAIGLPITYFFVPSLHSRPWRITPGPDGNLWFTDTDSDLIGKITPEGEITEYDIGSGKRPYDIVAGRDGNLWFTENVNNKTGAVDTSGNLVAEYYAPGVDARPAGITVAPNGDIWWVNSGAGTDPESTVSRLTPEGIVTNYELFPCACFGIGITMGADGNLWAVEELGVFGGEAPGTIDRISTDGQQIDRFRIPAPPFTEQHLPGWIAAGPDGKVWFTEFNKNQHKVGTATRGGTITEYQLPGDPSGTGTITTGIDGRLWVTEPDVNKVTILRTDGSAVGSMTVHQQPFGITIGPDGNMWFTNALSGEIGRIETAQPGVSYVLDIAPGFVPARRAVPLGRTVRWVLEAPGMHGVADASGLGLYGSGLRPPVSFFAHSFGAAGTFPYVDPVNGDSGSIAVRMQAPPTGRIGRPFPLTWATSPPAAGLVHDVQVLPPGSSSWLPLRTGVTITTDQFVPTAGGVYQFRARMRKADGSAATGWSPPQTVTVS